MLIDYNMTRDYRSHWTVYDAIREMVQNASDAGDYECTVDDKTVTVKTKNAFIPLETLMLGESQKSSDSVGRYGEGYKIGMMILTREGLLPRITSGCNLLSGAFIKNQLNVESFNIQVQEVPSLSKDTVFTCNVGDIDVNELKRRIPAFEKQLDLPGQVNVLQDRPGLIYVNGLFVCESKLTHGYNFNPNYIELNTDRNMASGVAWQLAQFYGSCSEEWAEHIFLLIENDANDVSDLSYWLHNEKLKAELARLFYNKYGEGSKIARPGNSYYYGGSSCVSASTNSARTYTKVGIQEAKQKADPDAPHSLLEKFLETNKSKLRRDVRAELSSLIERAKGWSKASIF